MGIEEFFLDRKRIREVISSSAVAQSLPCPHGHSRGLAVAPFGDNREGKSEDSGGGITARNPRWSQADLSRLLGCNCARDFTSLGSKVLWLLNPEVVPIFDSQAWQAITVVARLSDKVPTPQTEVGFGNDRYCTFQKLHVMCFGELYEKIDKLIGADFSEIFDHTILGEARALKEDAKRQYANHMTVIDQLLWHAGNEVALVDCMRAR